MSRLAMFVDDAELLLQGVKRSDLRERGIEGSQGI